MLFAPRGPALRGGFEINHRESPVRQEFAQEAGLGADMLDVEMPIIAGFDRLADSLFGRIAIGQRIKDEKHFFAGGEGSLRRRVDVNFDFGFERERSETFSTVISFSESFGELRTPRSCGWQAGRRPHYG